MRDQPVVTILLGLGTNLGDRAANLRRALRRLSGVLRITACSPVYETPPWGLSDQPLFLNACLAGETHLEAKPLLDECKQIERDMGRAPAERWGPRLIDIDLLFYDGLIMTMPGLTVPHPRLGERAFVLRPLADITPGFLHPVLGLTVAELLARAPGVEMRVHPIDWASGEGADV